MTKPINDRIAELYKDVFYFALSRIDNYRDAEDIAQMVMEKALKKTYMLRNEDKLKSWVMRITSNEINMYFRKVKKINSILFNIEEVFDGNQDIDLGIAGLEKDVLQHITGKTDEMNICRALERIDDKYQIVLQLHLVCEFDFAKTAEILNVNINSVKTRYYRGLRVLKKEFLKLENGGAVYGAND